MLAQRLCLALFICAKPKLTTHSFQALFGKVRAAKVKLMRCVMSKLASQSRITLEQFRTARQWNNLSAAYRRLLSGSYDEGARVDAGRGKDRLQAFERAVIRRYRMLAPILGPIERDIIEGRGRYPRTIGELCAVRVALDEIARRWSEAG